MSTTPLALAGLLSSVMVMAEMSESDAGDAEDEEEQELFTVIGLLVFATGSCQTPLPPLTTLNNGIGNRGPYGIIKSDTLEKMLVHSSDRWYRQFFRCVSRYASSTLCLSVLISWVLGLQM